jgi:hypothetical protein
MSSLTLKQVSHMNIIVHLIYLNMKGSKGTDMTLKSVNNLVWKVHGHARHRLNCILQN